MAGLWDYHRSQPRATRRMKEWKTREPTDSGVRHGPAALQHRLSVRMARTYYKMGVAISSPAHFEMELSEPRFCSTIC